MYQPNTADADSYFKEEVKSRLSEHSYHNMNIFQINMSCIFSRISRLKYSKSAGHDGIVNEHIIFGGYYLAVYIFFLFNAMLRHSTVPADFLPWCHCLIVEEQKWGCITIRHALWHSLSRFV